MRAPALTLAALAALPLLSACEALEGVPPGMLMAGATTGVLIATDKTVTDHVFSYVRDEDCRTTAYLETGHYCRPNPEPVTLVQEPLYCYRTLADVECHRVPDPFGGASRPVSQRLSREVAVPASQAPDAAARIANFR
jgi:hypothetical protein